jgi:hypothetical protein
VSYSFIVPEWAGSTVFILGCGPSLIGFDSRSLYGQRVIAINDSFELAPWADILYFCDKKWWDTRKHKVRDQFTGRRIVTLENQIDGVTRLRNTGDAGLETDPAGLRHGSNSGYQCINLAYHLGAKRIVLLGYDMQVIGNDLHWNQKQRPERQDPAGFTQTLNIMLMKFPSLVVPLQREGIEVINATPNSRLKCWPYVALPKILQQLSMRANG